MYSADLLKAIIENVIDGILVIDQDGIILMANPSACNLFGYPVNELYGHNINMLMPSPDRDQHDKYLKRHASTRESHIIGIGREIIGLKKNGIVFPARLAVSEVKYNGRNLYTSVIHDLTQEKKTEEKLRQHADELETVVEERTHFLKNIVKTLEQAKDEVNTSLLKEKEVNQLKTRFVSMASHEFRTPLSSIQLSASLIEHYYDRLDKQKIFSHLGKIKMAVGSLTAILNDFLSVEKIEQGKVNVVYREFDLSALCGEIVDAMRMQLKAGQKIIYMHSGDTTTVMLDSDLLQNTLLNLVSNSIKYSNNDGFIEVKSEITASACIISIKDNGIGIPQEDQCHLFEAFFRAQNTQDIQGTGLGLNIVKRYTELMNGSVSFESDVQSGTTFTLIFPIKDLSVFNFSNSLTA
ncbi:PAS domain-containing sensor histidine kinase [Mucilaginibacter sp. BJC16-A38]|uniref:PAS domain-containing sensor histidine kinase n=1 Tax=Mucilaginibacter phenanthrenivorans TaxID=1234842 RepID=UPI0021586E38|nr:PAS domain-containing sensor histidine kinase [Mucilaginibacter phenanthrenivorans]MCR8560783.1 PAS domain-containing sensor histidine kinase [Mucilaginibacter phenanthrenivorans]